MQKYNMRLNLKKCVLYVDSGKLLGFITSHKGIEVDTKKIDAIVNMLPPTNISQLHTLKGRIQFIHHFVASLVDQCYHLHISLRKKSSLI